MHKWRLARFIRACTSFKRGLVVQDSKLFSSFFPYRYFLKKNQRWLAESPPTKPAEARALGGMRRYCALVIACCYVLNAIAAVPDESVAAFVDW